MSSALTLSSPCDQVGPVKGPDGETRFVWDGRVILAGTVGAPLGSLLSTPLELLKVQVRLAVRAELRQLRQ